MPDSPFIADDDVLFCDGATVQSVDCTIVQGDQEPTRVSGKLLIFKGLTGARQDKAEHRVVVLNRDLDTLVSMLLRD